MALKLRVLIPPGPLTAAAKAKKRKASVLEDAALAENAPAALAAEEGYRKFVVFAQPGDTVAQLKETILVQYKRLFARDGTSVPKNIPFLKDANGFVVDDAYVAAHCFAEDSRVYAEKPVRRRRRNARAKTTGGVGADAEDIHPRQHDDDDDDDNDDDEEEEEGEEEEEEEESTPEPAVAPVRPPPERMAKEAKDARHKAKEHKVDKAEPSERKVIEVKKDEKKKKKEKKHQPKPSAAAALVGPASTVAGAPTPLAKKLKTHAGANPGRWFRTQFVRGFCVAEAAVSNGGSRWGGRSPGRGTAEDMDGTGERIRNRLCVPRLRTLCRLPCRAKGRRRATAAVLFSEVVLEDAPLSAPPARGGGDVPAADLFLESVEATGCPGCEVELYGPVDGVQADKTFAGRQSALRATPDRHGVPCLENCYRRTSENAYQWRRADRMLASRESASPVRIADFLPLAFKTVTNPTLFRTELAVLRHIDKCRRTATCPHIIHLTDHFTDDNGDPILVFRKHEKLSWEGLDLIDIACHARELMLALRAIHSVGIAHLDVNPANLMKDKKGRLVLIDFGLARECVPEDQRGRKSAAVDASPNLIGMGV
ncbi:MAG: hypothetical protein BJ554DRAFT_4121, partial [Olpidium bornovanus]